MGRPVKAGRYSRPDSRRASPHLYLISQLGEEAATAVVPGVKGLVDLIGLVDGVDGRLDLPQVLRGDVVAGAAELALDGDALVVVGGGGPGVEGRATLRVGIVVVVVPITEAVVVPARGGVDQPRGVELLDARGQVVFGEVARDLAPAFVIDNLHRY